MAFKNYRRFLTVLHEELIDGVFEAENCGWHHSPDTAPEWRHYFKLI